MNMSTIASVDRLCGRLEGLRETASREEETIFEIITTFFTACLSRRAWPVSLWAECDRRQSNRSAFCRRLVYDTNNNNESDGNLIKFHLAGLLAGLGQTDRLVMITGEE